MTLAVFQVHSDVFLPSHVKHKATTVPVNVVLANTSLALGTFWTAFFGSGKGFRLPSK